MRKKMALPKINRKVVSLPIPEVKYVKIVTLLNALEILLLQNAYIQAANLGQELSVPNVICIFVL
jgi:hypothetical protein